MKTPLTVAIVNARIRTGEPRRPWADAMLIRSGVIEMIGSSAEVKKRVLDDVPILDLHGRTVVAAGIPALAVGGPGQFTILDSDAPM